VNVPATLATLLSHPDFGISELTPSDGDTQLDWVHSSDLANPSPFLATGQMLLTTGRQFPESDDHAFYGSYVKRLRAAGVVALGFGTEVIRAGTPAGLISACRSAGLPLVEVPYRTPFIAISQWVGAVQAADSRARTDWLLATQNAISVAALGEGGIRAAMRKTASRLGCSVALFDADGELTDSTVAPKEAGSAPWTTVVSEVDRLLGAQRRSRSDLDLPPLFATIQTLGSARHLSGALVLARRSPFDVAEVSIATTLVALAEVSLEHSQSLRVSLRALMEQLFVLLRDGRIVEVRKAIEAIPAGIPADALRVVSVGLRPDEAALRDALERRAAVPGSTTFVVGAPEGLTLLVEPRDWRELETFLRRRDARAGVSDPLAWDQLNVGIVQADRALERARPGALMEFSDLVSASFLGLLSSSRVAEIATARLSPVLGSPGGRALLDDAAVWLRHNASWDPAARELGVHRHTLKARVEQLGGLLGLDLRTFQDRAELWALLSSIDIAGG
jgi:purine catabolism regulator